MSAIKLVEKDHPEYDWPYANLADLLFKTGDARQAFNDAAKAADRNPLSARLYRKSGLVAKAEEARQRFLAAKAHEPAQRK